MSLLGKIFGSSVQSKPHSAIDWRTLASDDDLKRLLERSSETNCVIFKHSSRCSISFMARKRLERNWDLKSSEAEPWFLDLITFRSLSNHIAEYFSVQHQSPQVIVVRNGQAVYHASHGAITVEHLRQSLDLPSISK